MGGISCHDLCRSLIHAEGIRRLTHAAAQLRIIPLFFNPALGSMVSSANGQGRWKFREGLRYAAQKALICIA